MNFAPLKILHVVPTYLPAIRYGGPIGSVHGLAASLSGIGHKVEVITTNVDGNHNSAVPLKTAVLHEGVTVRYFPSFLGRRLYRSPEMKIYLAQHIRDFDIVHLHSVFLWPTLIAARLARANQVPYLVSPRGMLVKNLIKSKSSLIKWAWIYLFERQTLENASAIHATSRLEKEELMNFQFQFPPIYEVPNGIEDLNSTVIETVSEKIKTASSSPYVLFLGRVSWKKGLNFLVEAMTYLKNFRLVIAGNDEENLTSRLQSLAAKKQVSEKITFLGPVSSAEKKYLFRNAKIFILPSDSENFANTVLESIQHGCPVILTQAVGLSEFVQNQKLGLIVRQHAHEIAKAIETIYENPDISARARDFGPKIVNENFSWPKIAKDMDKVYRSVLNQKDHADAG